MLAPDNRAMLMDALRPPEGYQFDRGVGTTFTLDLLTMLVAPLSLALHDISSATDALNDPVLMLDGVRQYADRLTLYCQAGYIAIPRRSVPLFRFLEDMVVEVKAPNGGLFHPKVWLLRYTSNSEAPAYRFLCLSRNMTFSRSWDLMLRLDGSLQDREYGYSRNAPLAEFLAALPEFAVRTTSHRALETTALFQDEVRKLDFQIPWPFAKDSLEFIPLGYRSHRRYRLDTPKWRSLTVSPFLNESVLKDVVAGGEDHVLLSEAESLRLIDPETLKQFSKIHVFNDAAMAPPEDEQVEEVQEGAPAEDSTADPSRLHAKLFVFEQGRDAKWLIGSANATRPALNGENVEFMVGLVGPKSKVGIEKILGDEKDELSLRALLAEYQPEEQTEPKPDERAVEEVLKQVREHLVDRRFKIRVREDDAGGFEMHIASRQRRITLPDANVRVRLWPVTLQESRGKPLDLEDSVLQVTFGQLDMLQLSTFIAFDIEARIRRAKAKAQFVLNLPISGLPAQRDDHLLTAILTDQTQFLRYLRFLLAEELGWPVGTGGGWDGVETGVWGRTAAEDLDIPLLEDLARALSRSPKKIDLVDKVVQQLATTEHGRAILPRGFEQVWDAIRAAKEPAK
jgi:hypothetical protein